MFRNFFACFVCIAALLTCAAQSIADASKPVVLAECPGMSSQVKPALIVLACGDGWARLKDLKWSDWGGDSAHAVGTLSQRVCDPDCARGHDRTSPATVTVLDKKTCPDGDVSYTSVKYAASESGQTKVETQQFPCAMVAAAISSAPTTPTPKLGPEWAAQSLGKSEYLDFMRQETDGSQSELQAFKNVCQCKVDETILDFKKSLAAPGVTITIDKTTACGQPAEHLIATGIFSKTNEQPNREVVDFRSGPAIYYLVYLFDAAKPKPAVEALLPALCPK